MTTMNITPPHKHGRGCRRGLPRFGGPIGSWPQFNIRTEAEAESCERCIALWLMIGGTLDDDINYDHMVGGSRH